MHRRGEVRANGGAFDSVGSEKPGSTMRIDIPMYIHTNYLEYLPYVVPKVQICSMFDCDSRLL
jgi:hypothetical protein